MPRDDLPTLEKLLGDTGSVRPIGELKDRGIQRIRVLSESQLRDSMRLAVNRALRHQIGSLELPGDVLERLRQAAEWEYRRLLDQGLESHSPDFPTTLVPEALPPAAAVSPVPGSSVGAVPPPPVASLDVSSPEFLEVEQRMARNLTELLGKDWRSELEQVTQSQQTQLSALEARIGKLVHALESTDRMLATIHQGRDHTVSSAQVQDPSQLDPSSPLFDRKSELLTALFQANMELRELRDQRNDRS